MLFFNYAFAMQSADLTLKQVLDCIYHENNADQQDVITQARYQNLTRLGKFCLPNFHKTRKDKKDSLFIAFYLGLFTPLVLHWNKIYNCPHTQRFP